jgi:hypothetical protein
MIIISVVLSFYLLIGILMMMFSLYIARKHGADMRADIVIKGILFWFFSFPEFLALIWTTIKLVYWKEKIRWGQREMIKIDERYQKILKKYKEMK